MRRIATWMVLLGMLGVMAPNAVSQEKRESAAQEARERQAAHKDVPADLQRARQALENAMRELEASGDQWGGHRVAAMNHIKAALGEIQKAETYAKEHKLVK